MAFSFLCRGAFKGFHRLTIYMLNSGCAVAISGFISSKHRKRAPRIHCSGDCFPEATRMSKLISEC
ncbi:hypothetical protein SCA6_005548 [Theobroma cacao]